MDSTIPKKIGIKSKHISSSFFLLFLPILADKNDKKPENNSNTGQKIQKKFIISLSIKMYILESISEYCIHRKISSASNLG